MAQAHVFIKGRVQGVFCRRFTKRQAKALGLSGWVKNLPNGQVEVKLAGDKKQIKKAIAKLRQGPRLAKVENIEIFWQEPEEFSGFEIR